MFGIGTSGCCCQCWAREGLLLLRCAEKYEEVAKQGRFICGESGRVFVADSTWVDHFCFRRCCRNGSK